MIFLDGDTKSPVKLLVGPQESGVDKTKKIPQFTQMIFNGCTGGDEAKPPIQAHRGL